MQPKTQTGYLVLADISGYTFFLANTELEHAQIALSYLLETMVTTLGQTLTVSKLEGDAVLAYLDERHLPMDKTLLGLLDQTYQAFRDQAATLHAGATCPCRACKAIPSLDLKFLVHHGAFMVQQVAGIKDLLGSDVNLVHRLAKNSVARSTGWRGYALFTRAGLERSRTDQQAFVQQQETIEHLGEVDTYVLDMQARYQAMKAT
jgi:hypothetical protein